MLTVPSTEFSKNFGKYRDAVQREKAVAITSHERVSGFYVSAEIYDEYTKLKAKATKSFATAELSEETIRAIANTKMAARHDHLNALLDE